MSLPGPKKIIWATDPWDSLDHSRDTTIRLMDESLRLGIETYWTSSQHILKSTQSSMLLTVPWTNPFDPTALIKLQINQQDQIHYRVDPPVDLNYILVLDHLEAIVKPSRATLLNPPSLLRHFSEKLAPDGLKDLMPKSQMIGGLEDCKKAAEIFKNEKEWVSKPLNQAQSIGVKKHSVPTGTKDQALLDWEKIATELTDQFTIPILAQEFLPGIEQGEIRTWFVFDQVVGSLRKHPKKGDFRVLIDEGSVIEAHTPSAGEMIRLQRIGAELKRMGIALAAVDCIGDRIVDFNFTSPGLLVQMEQVHGNQNFSEVILGNLYRV